MQILCPHCKGIFDFHEKNSLGLTPMQAELLKLADGTRTAEELSAILKRSRESLYAGIQILRYKGFTGATYKGAEAYPKKHPERDLDIYKTYKAGGTTFRKLGEQHKLSASRIAVIVAQQWRVRNGEKD